MEKHMNDCSKEKKKSYLAILFLFINTIIIIFVTSYVGIGVVSIYGILVFVYFFKLSSAYTDCIEKKQED